MTRLSDALQRAAETSGATATALPGPWDIGSDERNDLPNDRRNDLPNDSPNDRPNDRHPLRFPNDERALMVVGDGADTALVEQYRHLAAALHRAQNDNGVRSVMVTSAVASEGKTLTAVNLALTLSHSYQRRVLLIDADLRRPRLREIFGVPPGEGLTDSLERDRGGRLPLHQVSPTLWVLTAGRPTDDPMSTLVSPAMKQLLDEARDAFDWIVVDTPPIAILPDANLLAAMIDTALLVVSAKSTPYPMVRRAVDAIGAGRVLGVVLNRVEKSSLPAGYGYYRHVQ